MSAIYQKSDWEVVDYQLDLLDPEIFDSYRGRELIIRGPKPKSLKKNSYFVCLGAAQTFGRFCAKPYPNLLSERLRLPVLNLGFGGVSISFFWEDHPKILDYINNAKFVIIQVLSGRSQGNSLFKNSQGFSITKVSDGTQMPWVDAYTDLIDNYPRTFVEKIITETRQNWVDSYVRFLEKIHVPKILFWFSQRKATYKDNYQNVHGVFNQFPQLVNSDMISQLQNYIDDSVECTSIRGMPQKITSRFTGKPIVAIDDWDGREWSFNDYYPSPEMHLDAYEALKSSCQKYSKPLWLQKILK